MKYLFLEYVVPYVREIMQLAKSGSVYIFLFILLFAMLWVWRYSCDSNAVRSVPCTSELRLIKKKTVANGLKAVLLITLFNLASTFHWFMAK